MGGDNYSGVSEHTHMVFLTGRYTWGNRIEEGVQLLDLVVVWGLAFSSSFNHYTSKGSKS